VPFCFQTNLNYFCLPNLFLAGFPKSATTYFHYCLLSNDHIFGGKVKETHFLVRKGINKTFTQGYLDDFSDVIKDILSTDVSTNVSPQFYELFSSFGKFMNFWIL